jgi:1,4-dihydroxy-2-naphthoate octaprenyltransferase
MTLKNWLIAIRPKTLPIAVLPLIVGWSNANWVAGHIWFVACITAILLQILSNISNDLFDYIRGADDQHRTGPLRVVHNNLIPPVVMLKAIYVIVWILSINGLFLYLVRGWPILLLGISSIICALLYTATPLALAYNGLGEVAVFIFFGLVNVLGSEYVTVGHFHQISLYSAISCGLLAASVMLCNNIRDINSDSRVGKKTLAVIIGLKPAIGVFYLLISLPYILLFTRFNNLFLQHTFFTASVLFSMGMWYRIISMTSNALKKDPTYCQSTIFNKNLILSVGHLICYCITYCIANMQYY